MLTLEMPDTGTEFNPGDAPSTTLNPGTAQTAADLLEQGEAEGGECPECGGEGTVDSGGFDPQGKSINIPCGRCFPESIDNDTGPTDVGGDLESTLEAVTAAVNPPAKKKRTRKAKQEPQPGVDPTWCKDVPFDTNKPRGGPDQNAIVGSNVREPLPPKPEPTAEDKATAENLANLPKEPSQSQRAYQIACLETDYVRLCLEINEVESAIDDYKTRLKTLQAEYAEMSVELRHARNDALYQPRLPFKPDSPPAAAVEGSANPHGSDSPCSTAAAAESASTPPIPADFYPDAWRAASIDELNLTESLANSIREGTPTIGELADRIGEINQGRAKWHKGVGAAKRTLVEDALNKWLNVNRDSATFAALEGEQSVASDSGLDTQGTSQDTSPAAVSPTTELTDDEADAALIARAAALNTGKENCLAHVLSTDKCWRSGYEAYGRMIEGVEEQLTDCPYIPGDEQDDWLRGFMSARALKDYPDAEPLAGGLVKEAVTGTTTTSIFDSLDDI